MNNFLNKFFLFMLLSISGSSHAVKSIEVQALFSSKAVVLIDDVRRVLSVGKTSPEGVKLIAATSKGATLEVDGEVKDYLLGTSISLTYKVPELQEETIFANDNGMYLRVGAINGLAVQFLIDTGATTIAMNKKQAKRLGIRYKTQGIKSGVSTASGFETAYEVKLKSVSLGGIKQYNVTAMVIDGNHPGPILLGMSFLSALTVETAGNAMVLKQRK